MMQKWVAKLLHLDDRMGSLKVGKDADVVIWSDNPLSIYAVAEKTWVDGRRLFDRKKDVQLQEDIATERARLVQKMLAEKKGGAETKPVEGKKQRLYHCNDLEHGSHQFDEHATHHGH